MLLNFLSDNKSLEELPNVCLLVIGFTSFPDKSSSFEQETNRTNPIVKIAIIFFKPLCELAV